MTEDLLKTALQRAFGTVKEAGEWLRVPCPTCEPKDQKKMKRHVHKRHHHTHCFICANRSSLMELLGPGHTPPPRSTGPEMEVKKVPHSWAFKLPCLAEPVPVNQLPADHLAVQFLRKDHLLDLDRYHNENGVVWCPSHLGVTIFNRPFISSAERLLFPVTFSGKLVGWQMRAIPGTTFGDNPACIKYCQLYDKGKYLYNYDIARKSPVVVVVEGVKKALKFHNAVATLGKSITPHQVQLLRAWKRVVILLDGEDSTQELAQTLADGLSLDGGDAIAVDPRTYGFDSPDEATEQECADMVVDAMTKRMRPL